MSRNYVTLRNPGLNLTVLLLAVYFAIWVVCYLWLKPVLIAGVPLITWGMIGFGVFATLLGAFSVYRLESWEKNN